MASGRITLTYTTTSNTATTATVSVTMTYYGNGETYNSSPSSNNCHITLNGDTVSFRHAYTTSGSAQTMGSATFTIRKTHSTQSLTASGTITNYSTVYSNPTATCAVSVSAQTSYTVSYNANGGTGAPSAQTKWYNEDLILSSTTPTRTGYKFRGWAWSSAPSTVSFQPGSSYKSNSAATLTAVWKNYTKTFTFNSNTGTGLMSDQVITYDSSKTTALTANSFTKANYNFIEWNTVQNGTGTVYTDQQIIQRNTITSDSTINLYAQWQQAYIASTVTNINAYRCNSSGAAQDEGTYGYLIFKVSRYNNGSSYSYPTVSATYGSNSLITLSYTEDTTNNIRTYTSSPFGNGGLSVDNQYNITITITDSTYGNYTASTFISPAAFTIDVNETGTGIGFLTSAPDNGVVVGDDLTLYKPMGNSPSLIFQRGDLDDNSNDWRIYDKGGWLYFGQRGSGSTNWPTTQEWSINTSGLFSGTINWSNVNNKPDYITAQGTVTESTNGSGLWRYRKWNSGFQEVWYCGSVNFTNATSNSANGWYRRIKDFAIPYDSMTNITAFNDNAVPVVTGAYSGTLLSTGGFKSSGTIVELQEISGATIYASTVTGWNIYIAGMPR